MNLNSINTCIVIGAGFSGLISALYLARKNIKVTIIDKRIFDTTEFRFKTKLSQQEHVHLLTKAGMEHLFTLFPDFKDKFKLCFFPELDFTEQIKWNGPLGSYPQFSSGFGKVFTFSRGAIDEFLLDQVKENSNIHLVTNNKLINASLAEGKICSIEVFDSIKKSHSIIEANLYILATGRKFDSYKFLESLNIMSLVKEEIPSKLFYRSFKFKTDYFKKTQSKAIMTTTFGDRIPDGAVLYPIEQDKYILTQVSRDFKDDVISFCANLHDPEIHTVLKDATDIKKDYIYKILGSKRIKFSHASNWPQNIVALGDSVISLNPIFAQGLSVSTLHLGKLDEWLNTNKEPIDFQKSIDSINDSAWLVGTIEDKRINAKGLKKFFYNIGETYVLFLLKKATSNSKKYLSLIKVLNFKSSIFSFLKPWS